MFKCYNKSRRSSGSPFPVKIKDQVDPNKVQVYGDGINPSGVRSGQPATFTVDPTAAGEAPLEATTTDATGTIKLFCRYR